mmetsp:Transcript_11406/g.26806  ORF Transcript_11406/g.26806 Transcript_11406/m.26806 type:complete len:282 (-) Transcript_11406:2231-3076(-)
MISARSTLTRSLFGGRYGTKNSAVAFLQLPTPSFSSEERDGSNNSVALTSVRKMSSPAYRRFVRKKASGIQGLQPAIDVGRGGVTVPSLAVAKDMGKGFSEMENEPLVVISEMGNHMARMEVLRRHIMAVDNVDYYKADETLKKIAAKNAESLTLDVLPYAMIVAAALGTGFMAIPMVFSVDLAIVFNEKFVTMEIPPPEDLDTWLETGAWTWNWMEPVLGTVSYTLLCLQVSRQQMHNLGIKPLTSKVMEKRSRKLYAAFPQYDRTILHKFVETDAMVKV